MDEASIPGNLGLTGLPYPPHTTVPDASGRTILSTPVLWGYLPRFFGVELSPKRRTASLEVMDQAKALAEINKAKFGLNSKNTIVAVLGETRPSKKFHH